MSSTTLVSKELEESSTDVDLTRLTAQEKNELIAADAESIASNTTTLAPTTTFHPAKSLYIDTKGIPVLRLPLPPSELVIAVYRNHGEMAYQSTRKRRRSGNCVLSDAEGRSLVQTTYFFGPGKDPVLALLEGATSAGKEGENEIRTASKWTSRAQTFILPSSSADKRTFTWEYKKERGFGGPDKKGNALVCSMEGKRIAVLVRNDETRTPGSKSCSAGNGGELVLGEDVGTEGGLSEEIVVATCLLMLKKEIDRRRTVQAMMLSAAVSGGS